MKGDDHVHYRFHGLSRRGPYLDQAAEARDAARFKARHLDRSTGELFGVAGSLGDVQRGHGGDRSGSADQLDDIRSEADVRVHRPRYLLRRQNPPERGVKPLLDIFLWAAIAELARQVIRRGWRLLL